MPHTKSRNANSWLFITPERPNGRKLDKNGTVVDSIVNATLSQLKCALDSVGKKKVNLVQLSMALDENSGKPPSYIELALNLRRCRDKGYVSISKSKYKVEFYSLTPAGSALVEKHYADDFIPQSKKVSHYYGSRGNHVSHED